MKKLSHKLSFVVLAFFTIIFLVSCGPNLEKFKNKIEPKIVLSLNPSENNPRNSEGDFIKLNNGRLLYIYTHYYAGSGIDNDPAYLASRFSDDEGETWSNTDSRVIENEGNENIMSVSLLRLHNGNIALFYCVKNSITDCTPYLRISTDEAFTWEEPIRCIPNQIGYFTLNNDRVIQLKNGRLLMPLAHFNNNTTEAFDPYGILKCYYSDDSGITWNSGDTIPNKFNKLVQEPGVIEMNDGRIMMFARSNDGKQQVSFSKDKGLKWSNIKANDIYSPLSPSSIEKDPESGIWVMVWNNNDNTNEDLQGRRTPLTLAISKNEGNTWEIITNLECDTKGWYCYTAIHFDNENILLSYCSGDDLWKNGLNYTSLNKFSRSWLYNSHH